MSLPDQMTDVKATDPGVEANDYLRLNAELNLWVTDEDGTKRVNHEADRKAVRAYFLNHVNPNTQYFSSLEEKLQFLVTNGYYEKAFLEQYSDEFIKKLYKHVYSFKFRFPTFISAYKAYQSYMLRTFDGKRYLERWEDRIATVALYLGRGDEKLAHSLATEMIEGRYQPATPTFMNAGRAARGELVSCFLLSVEDDLNSIFRAVNSGAQLSKRGGGVAFNLSNLRAKGDPIKGILGAASGVVPVMKVLEDTSSYVNQLGQRAGAFAVYLNALHLDILDFLDTKRENADEKIRMKTLSIGVVIPDVLFTLARKGQDVYRFSPHDVAKVYGKEFSELNLTEIYDELVDNPRIRKEKMSARNFLTTLAEIQMESGYPYILFEDAANRANNVGGKIKISNLCSEILQPQYPSVVNDQQQYTQLGEDISCNLGSLNIKKALESPDFGKTVETSIRALFAVSDLSDIEAVPTVQNGNSKNHSVGLGAMNLHGTFAHYQMFYGDEESLDLTNMYFYVVNYHAMRTNMLLAKETGEKFAHFDDSKYATGEYFEKFINPANPEWFTPRTEKVKEIFANIHIPTSEDWATLARQVKKHGLRLSHTLAIPPTGSISYISNSTSSIHPVAIPGGLVETRSEGKIGNIYAPTAHSEGNEEFFRGVLDAEGNLVPGTATDMYSIDDKKVIDVYSVAQFYVDQGMSLTLGVKSSETTKTIVQNILYGYSKGKPSSKELDERGKVLAKFPSAEIKTFYYVRVLNESLDALNASNECVSCAL